ncbi:hypothetical protein AB0M46_13645 [Dactylosporangium sp. NPDC051485]|uniref:hypothetical protein n=1 Tax=Dactylosporangium sp. NPDC051485 TaxID=3154846 RepID=UPI0034155E0D
MSFYQQGTNTFAVRVYDPANGALLYDGALPEDRFLSTSLVMDSSAPASRVRFSPDRSYLYYIGGDRGCDLVLLKWTPGGYIAHAAVKPPTTFSSSGTCFDEPHFEDGKLVATAKDDKQQPTVSTRYAIDPARPAAAPTDLGPEKFAKQDLKVNAPPDGAKDWTATALTYNGKPARIDVDSGWLPWPFCRDQITDTTWLCAALHNTTDPKDETPYGAVAVATVDVAAGTVSFASAAPTAKLNAVLLSPDRQSAITYSTTAGFYRIDLKGGAAPVKLFDVLAKSGGQQAAPAPYTWI